MLLLGAGATGSETLKNLVLGGIAAFTIVDDARVCAADLGNNFMLEERHQQQPRAACVTELLYELNEAVRAAARHLPHPLSCAHSTLLCALRPALSSAIRP